MIYDDYVPDENVLYDKGDLDYSLVHENSAVSRKSGRAYRREMRKCKNNRLVNIVKSYGHKYDLIVKYDVNGAYVVRPRSSDAKNYAKRYTNKLIRRTFYVRNGNEYRKHFDYWWAVY